MSIEINADILQNLEWSQTYEWLERNKTGAYAASTVTGMNLRRTHGLFVVTSPEKNNRIILLSKLEDSVFLGNSLYELSANRYADTVFPKGFEYLQKFEMKPFPCFTYQIEDRLIQKTLFLLQDKNILVVRYELKNQGPPIKLVIKPFLAGRDSYQLIKENLGLNTDSYLGQSWVRWSPRADLPALYIYFNHGEFIPASLWYHNFFYPLDEAKGQEKTEDLFNPGFLQFQLKPYDTLDLYVSTEDLNINELDYEKLYRLEASRRFYPRKGNESHARYLDLQATFSGMLLSDEFQMPPVSLLMKERALRDRLIMMPAILLSENGPAHFRHLIIKILKELDNGLLPILVTENSTPFYGAADLSLWIFELAYAYFMETHDRKFFEEKLFDILRSIYEAYAKGTSGNIYLDKDGLLVSGNHTLNSSWIPLKDEKGEVLRYGKLLEINALWFNALKILERLSLELNKKRFSNKFRKAAEKTALSFSKVFFNPESGLYYDFVNEQQKNEAFRINQIIPISLSFSPLEPSQARHLLSAVEKKLVTPFGLKSLDTDRKLDERPISRRQAEYFNGAVWPWTINLYVRSCLLFKNHDAHFANDLFTYFAPLLETMNEGLLGYVPEVLKLNRQVHQHGLPDYAPAVAALIWVGKVLHR